MPAPTFVHLRTHSAFSLSESAIKIDDLIAHAKKLGIPAVGLTDNGNLFGSLEFSYAASGAGIQPIIGAVIQVVLPGREDATRNTPRTGDLVLIAKNQQGYHHLLKLVSLAHSRKGDAEATPTLNLQDLEGHTDGLIALTGGVNGMLGRYFAGKQSALAGKVLEQLKSFFPGHLYVEIQRISHPLEAELEPIFLDLAYRHELPLVATNDCYFLMRDMHEAANVLLCISDGKYISEADRRTFMADQYFRTTEEMQALFADLPEAIANTVVIARRCGVMSPARNPMLPSFPTGAGRSESEELVHQAKEGLKFRLGGVENPEYTARLQFELDVIIRMQFAGYFLIVSDFIKWSKDNDIPVGPGRGSGAGSLVAWSLLITDLDPIRFGLLFERFLNPERVSMPDFDIDFCQERRDEVIAYVREKYGSDRVAHIITFGKLQARAVLRDVGRVLQMPYGQIDRICKMIPFNPAAPVTLQQAIDMDAELRRERDADQTVARLLDIGLKLEGLYRHASTHAAGVVIADRPLDELIPVYYDPRTPLPITQYAMKQTEQSGLVKFDFLGLKTLTVIAEAVKLLKLRDINLDITTIPLDDAPSYKLLADGRTTGVFQVESAGMRDALRKLKPDTFEDIIALISLYRPGPMENIPTYIARKHKRERPDYMHPLLEPCLKETFGVIIYQEQVMEIAKVLAGYSLGGADLLRRAMGKKIKAEMDAQGAMFVKGAVERGVNEDQASGIFELVAKFAGYGFNKSHAAAYALIGYQTAYLKANYPVEFLAASMNLDIGDTDKLTLFREEAVLNGIAVLPPDVNKSCAKFTVEKQEDGKLAIRYALGALKGVGPAAMQELQEERAKNGAFKDIFDLSERLDPKVFTKRQIESLAKAGAFDSISNNRRSMFENATLLARYNSQAFEEKQSQQVNLFGGGESQHTTRPNLAEITDWPMSERMQQEYDAVGFYLSGHPLEPYLPGLKASGVGPIRTLEQRLSDRSTKIRLAGVVTSTSYRVSNGRKFAYFKLSDPSGIIEISIFNEFILNESRELLESKQPVLVMAEARKDEGGIRVSADSVTRLEQKIVKVTPVYHLVLDSARMAESLTALLKTRENGEAKLAVTVPTQAGMEVDISLPGKYDVNESDLGAFGQVSVAA